MLSIDGILVIVYTLSANLYVVVGIWIFLGLIGTVNSIATETIIQQSVSAEKWGRMFGIFNTVK